MEKIIEALLKLEGDQFQNTINAGREFVANVLSGGVCNEIINIQQAIEIAVITKMNLPKS